MKFKISIKDCGHDLQLSNIIIKKLGASKGKFKCVGNDFFTNDLSLAKQIKGILKNGVENFKVNIYVKLFIEQDIQYELITLINLKKEGKCKLKKNIS